MRIERVDKLSRCPAAVKLGVEALHKLHEQGWTEECCTGLGYDAKALVAYSGGGAAMGLMTYEEREWNNSLFISIGYVLPEWREQGTYRALWNELCAVAKEKGLKKIAGTCHWDNHRMMAVMETLKRRPQWITYEFRLPEEDKPCDS